MSGLLYVYHQVGFSTQGAIAAKMHVENWSYNQGVLIGKYTTDIGIFGAADFVNEILSKGQEVKYCGVGAHHQNGAAECSIQTVSNMACVMMLCASICWPDAANSSLWSIAVDYAIHAYKHMPNHLSGQSPLDINTCTLVPRHGLKDLHVWGCPCYVLDPKLHKGQKLPHWQPCSRHEVFVGMSPSHASNAPLVLNLKTGFISPQFHVVFDDSFNTFILISEGDTPPAHWENIFHESRYQAVFDENTDVLFSAEWLDKQNGLQGRHLCIESKVLQQIQVPADDIPGQMGQHPIMTLSNPTTSPDDV